MSERNSDKMATWPIAKLLYSMALPAVLSLFIQSCYNIVDTMYISQYSQDAMFAIGLVYPLQMVPLSLALGTGVGVGTLVSRRLGEKRQDDANAVATTGFVIAIIHIIIIILIGIFLSGPFLSLYTKRADIIALGTEYLYIVMCFNFGQFLSVLFERILQAQGNMIIPMISLIAGALTNIILDPIFIFGYFGIPEMGMAGAAIATVLGQIVSMIIDIVAFVKGSHDVKIRFKNFKITLDNIKNIYAVALPTAIMNMISSVTTTLMNGVLIKFSENAVTSLSLYFKLQSFVFMPCFGFNQGSLPILSYNYGSQNKKRYFDTVKLYIISVTIVMAIGTALFILTPDLMLSFFAMDESLREVARVTLQIIAISFIPAAFSIAFSTIFQSFGKGTTSMIQSILRQIGFLVPLAYLLSSINLEAVWFAYPIAEIIVVIIFIPLVIKAYKKAFGEKYATQS